METVNTLGIGKRVESPMAAFNNFMIDLGKELQDIYKYDVFGTNNCMFEDESILLFGFVKLMRVNNIMGIKFNDVITDDNYKIVERTLSSKNELSSIFFNYLFILNDIRHNYDDSISSKYVENIIKEIRETDKFEDKIYLVPYKNKIFRNYDKIDPSLEKLFTRYTYVLNVRNNGPIQYRWKLIRLLSSELNESYSIENIRPLEKEIIREGLIQKENIYQFMVKLMYYGDF